MITSKEELRWQQTLRWWERPERICNGDDRYQNIKGLRRREKEEMKEDCMVCPVYYDCLADLLSHPLWEHYGIQAGIEGRG